MTKEQRIELNDLREQLTERQNACNRADAALTQAETEDKDERVEELLDEAHVELS